MALAWEDEAEADEGRKPGAAKAAKEATAQAKDDVRRFTDECRALSLQDLVPMLQPQWRKPTHLAPLTDMLEDSLLGGVRGLCAVPMQHHKTSTMIVAIAWLLLRRKDIQIVFMTYSHERAESVAKDIRDVCKLLSIGPARGWNKIKEWQNEDGGGVTVMSVEQSKLGHRIDVLLVDDPLDEEHAFTLERRNDVDEKIAYYTARTQMHSGSVIIIASRWHIDDPIGRRLSRQATEWRVFMSPGLIGFGTDDCRAFAPDVLTKEQHLKLRDEWLEVDPSGRKWWAQIQNDPKPDALGLFRKPAMYGALPQYGGWRTAIGVDLAYSVSASADYFAIVVLRFYGASCYVLEAYRAHRDVEQAVIELTKRRTMHPGASFFSYASGPEKGVLQFLAERGIPIQVMPARYDKQTRAQRTIEAWNLGRVLVSERESWAPAFISRCELFTGSDKAGDDDEIDAMVSAFDGGMFSAVVAPTTLGRARI